MGFGKGGSSRYASEYFCYVQGVQLEDAEKSACGSVDALSVNVCDGPLGIFFLYLGLSADFS